MNNSSFRRTPESRIQNLFSALDAGFRRHDDVGFRKVTSGTLHWIFYTGRQFDAQEALQMGLVNRVLPPADLEKYVLDYANIGGDGNFPSFVLSYIHAVMPWCASTETVLEWSHDR